MIENEVRILTKNFIDSYASITSSHGGTLANLYNADNDAYWTNDDQDNFSHWDTVTMTLSFTFKVGTVETAFKTDSLILLNNNLRDFDVYYWNDDSTWALMLEIRGNEDKNLFLNFGAKTTSRMKLVLYNTMNPNERKKIGQCIIARNRIIVAHNFSVYEIGGREKVSTITLGDGSEHRAVSRFSQYRTNKFGCRVTFDFLDIFDYENLRSLKDEGEPFLFYPESDFKPDEIYLVHWVNPFTANYTSSSKLNGHSLTMELREV